jgi:hypothetical protein
MDPHKVPPMPSSAYRRDGMRTVHVPPAHEGIGRALQDAYSPARSRLPAEFEELLGRLP